MNRILVIEDEAELRENIVDILRYEGFTVFGAANGGEGITLARRELPDIILCDIMMPELDGYQVLLRLRTYPPTATIPFIFLTALNARSDTRYGMELGAEDYITKPFRSHELINAIQTQLRKQTQMSDLASQQMNALRDQVLVSIPHELRTPLVGIMGYAELMCMDTSSLTTNEVNEYAGQIFSSALRLHRLLENYIFYVQLQTMRFTPEGTALRHQAELNHPTEVIELQAQLVANRANRTHDIRFTFEPIAMLHIGQNYLEKVIEELVDNALKFSKSGQPVSISGHNLADGYQINIRDKGRGMFPDQLAMIGALRQFDRKTYEQQGSGMGLAIVKQIVELHGGLLNIESTQEEGTIVTFSLT
jgi:K+-sensing histidine kinase KdpD